MTNLISRKEINYTETERNSLSRRDMQNTKKSLETNIQYRYRNTTDTEISISVYLCTDTNIKILNFIR